MPQHGLQIKYELNISATELAAAVAESSLLKEVGVESGAVEQFNGLLRKLPGNLTVCKTSSTLVLFCRRGGGSGSDVIHL